jgi:tRNA (guanine-N7-)-methyltransferase
MNTYKKLGELRSYGRRKARKLNAAQQYLWDHLLPELAITLPEHGMIDTKSLQSGYSHIWLEIGFGAGEHLISMATRYPDIVFIGCEPFANGVAKCLSGIEKHALNNIRIVADDAQLLLDKLPDSCVTRTDILFPDPWRKKAHHKRRLVNPVTLDKLSRIMPSGATLWLASDHTDYVAWMLEHIIMHERISWQAQCKNDFLAPPSDWSTTRYQQKAMKEGRHATFLQCQMI